MGECGRGVGGWWDVWAGPAGHSGCLAVMPAGSLAFLPPPPHTRPPDPRTPYHPAGPVTPSPLPRQCGKEEDVQLWADMLAFQSPKKPILIENCHNGPNEPTADWCPFHYYRSSTDICPVYGSILANLATVPRLAEANLSTPGCWACASC